jgi:hypothetical protein
MIPKGGSRFSDKIVRHAISENEFLSPAAATAAATAPT